MHKSSQSFLGEVRDQIKSKEAKEFVAAELDHHIKEAKNKWMEKGVDEAAAEEKAVVQMGSPITLGQKLNKLHMKLIQLLPKRYRTPHLHNSFLFSSCFIYSFLHPLVLRFFYMMIQLGRHKLLRFL